MIIETKLGFDWFLDGVRGKIDAPTLHRVTTPRFNVISGTDISCDEIRVDVTTVEVKTFGPLGARPDHKHIEFLYDETGEAGFTQASLSELWIESFVKHWSLTRLFSRAEVGGVYFLREPTLYVITRNEIAEDRWTKTVAKLQRNLIVNGTNVISVNDVVEKQTATIVAELWFQGL